MSPGDHWAPSLQWLLNESTRNHSRLFFTRSQGDMFPALCVCARAFLPIRHIAAGHIPTQVLAHNETGAWPHRRRPWITRIHGAGHRAHPCFPDPCDRSYPAARASARRCKPAVRGPRAVTIAKAARCAGSRCWGSTLSRSTPAARADGSTPASAALPRRPTSKTEIPRIRAFRS